MSPINASPVRGSNSVMPEADPVEAAANPFVSLAGPTEGRQAIGSIVPPGGLHPEVHEPGTALFGRIFDTFRAAINKGSSGDPIKSIGEGVAPAAKAAGKTLGQAISAQ